MIYQYIDIFALHLPYMIAHPPTLIRRRWCANAFDDVQQENGVNTPYTPNTPSCTFSSSASDQRDDIWSKL